MRTELAERKVLLREDTPRELQFLPKKQVAVALAGVPKSPTPPPSTEPPSDVTGNFACIDCARKFKWNFTKRKGIDPFCSVCKSSVVKSISPNVSALAIIKGAIPQQMTKKEMKRVRFIRSQWRMRCELKEWIEGLSGLLVRTGFASPEINRAQNTMNELLASVDEQQQLRLAEYEQQVAV